MNVFHLVFPALIVAVVFLARWPHLRFPLDEDLATYTYIARFRHLGMRWKKDAFLFLYPIWRLQWIDRLYKEPKNGPVRVRLFLAAHNALSGIAIYGLLVTLTGNPWVGLTSGLLFAFFLTAPSLESESFNTEQCYVPFLLLGFWCALLDPAFAVFAGIAFGLMVVCKFTTAIYLPGFLALTWSEQGVEATFIQFVSAGLVVTSSIALDVARGFFDTESLRQIRARMVATLRTSKRDSFWPRLTGDLKLILKETLPLWLMGLPALLWSFTQAHGVWFMALTGMTLLMLFAQKAFTRYHYTPLVSLLAMTSGLGLAQLWELGGNIGYGLIGLAGVITLLTFKQQLPFYLKPTSNEILNRYGKFEQLIYLPYLGRALKRLTRRTKKDGQRLYIWGNFTQLYHYAGCPAADTYIYYAMGPWLDAGLEPIFDSIIGGLTKHQPAYLVKTYPDFDPQVLKQITGLDYRLMKTVLARYPVYRLHAFNPPTQDPLKLTWMEKCSWMEQLARGHHAPGISNEDLAQGRELKSLIECRKLVNLNDQDRDARIFLGELCERFGLHRQSASMFEWVLHRYPKLPRLRLMLARQKIILGDIEEARFLIKEEILRSGKSAETEQALGQMEQAQGEFRDAIDHFQNAIVEAPERWDLRLQQAACYEQLTEPASARKRFLQVWEGATEQHDQGFRAQAAAGLARIGAIVNPASASLYDFCKRDPENAPLKYAHASALEREGCPNEARTLFASLTKQMGTDILKASAWFRLGRLSEGEERQRCLRNAIKHNPYHYGAQELFSMQEAVHAQV